MLTYNDLIRLVDDGHILGVDKKHVNAASIDLHLADNFLFEDTLHSGVIDLAAKDCPPMVEAHSNHDGSVVLYPGNVVLAKTVEEFNLPNDIAGLFLLRSTPGRAFLDHMHSGWADPGFHGAPLTLQLKNCLQHSCIKLTPGLRIGQMVFFKGEEVPADASYAMRGNYNQNKDIAQAKH